MKEEIIKYCNSLNLNGYRFVNQNNTHLGFEKENDDIKVRVGFGNVEKMQSNGLVYHIVFKKYDKLNRNSIQENDIELNPPSIRPYTHNKWFNKQLDENYKNVFPIPFKTFSSFEKVIELLRECMESDIKPFVDYWKDIRTYLPFIEIDNKASSILLGSNYILKKMAIWKLCGHSNYDQWVAQKQEKIKQAYSYDKSKLKYKTLINEIDRKRKQLENVEPVYKWNPNDLIPQLFKGESPLING